MIRRLFTHNRDNEAWRAQWCHDFHPDFPTWCECCEPAGHTGDHDGWGLTWPQHNTHNAEGDQ